MSKKKTATTTLRRARGHHAVIPPDVSSAMADYAGLPVGARRVARQVLRCLAVRYRTAVSGRDGAR